MNLKNSPLEIKSRYYRSRMIVSAEAVIIFGAWYMLEIVIDFALRTAEFDMFMQAADTYETSTLAMTIGTIVTVSVALLSRLYVGRAAMREAKGGRTKNLYIFLAVIFMLCSAGDITLSIAEIIIEHGYPWIYCSVNIVFEFTSFIASFDLVCSAILMRRCEKKLNGATGHE